jgi:hypothetical protein
MRSKIRAWSFAESDGYGVSGKCKKEEAFEAIKEEMHQNDEGAIANTLKLEDVQSVRLYRHRNCDTGTVGDPDACYDCGEPHLSAGRPIFVWHRV